MSMRGEVSRIYLGTSLYKSQRWDFFRGYIGEIIIELSIHKFSVAHQSSQVM